MTFLDAYCARCAVAHEEYLRSMAEVESKAAQRLRVFEERTYYDKLYEVFGLRDTLSFIDHSIHFLVRDFLPTSPFVRRFMLSPSRALVRALIGHDVPVLDESHAQHIWALNCPSGLLFDGYREIRGLIYNAGANMLGIFFQELSTKRFSTQVTEINAGVQQFFPELVMDEPFRSQVIQLMHAFILHFSCERSLRQFVSSAPMPKDNSDRRKPSGKYSLFRPVALELPTQRGAFQTPLHGNGFYDLNRSISASGHIYVESCGEERRKLMWSRN